MQWPGSPSAGLPLAATVVAALLFGCAADGELAGDEVAAPGELRELATGIGSGWLDGLAVDACDNIYVADFDASQILRISSGGAETTMIIDGDLTYMPNMQWGSGIGGWDANKLYIPDGQRKLVYEVDIGVPSKSRPYPR